MTTDAGPVAVDILERATRGVQAGMTPPTQIVTGSCGALARTIGRLRDQVRREILAMDDTGYLLAAGRQKPMRNQSAAASSMALRPAVATRQVMSQTGFRNTRERRTGNQLAGEFVRLVRRIPVNMLILDRRVALLSADPTDPTAAIGIVRDPSVVATLVAIGQQLWQTGTEAGSLVDNLPSRLAVVLSALALGEPDDVACRRLGLSPRTYSRRVAELLAILGVDNRFQAGVEAARRGWL